MIRGFFALVLAAGIVAGLVLLRSSNRFEEERAAVSSLPNRAALEEETVPVDGLVGTGSTELGRTTVAGLIEKAVPPDGNPPPAIRGRFVDAMGLPIAGVAVQCVESAGATKTTSDEDGAFEFSPRIRPASAGAGRLTLRARCSGFTPADRVIRLQGRPVEWLGDWVLQSAATVSGTVRDPLGLGVADVRIGCLRDGILSTERETIQDRPFEELARSGLQAGTGVDGTFTLDGVPLGEIRLVACAEGWQTALSEVIEVRAGMDPIDIGLVARGGPATLVGVVLDPKGAGVPRARLSFRSASGSRTVFADEAGRFGVSGLRPDPLTIVATDPEGRWGEARLAGVRPGTDDLVLRLSATDFFMLLVRGDDGSPVEDYEVTLTSLEGTALLRRALARYPQGETEVVLPSTNFQITVQAPGWMPFVSQELSPSSFPDRWTVRLSPARGVSGIVVGNGSAVAAAVVSIHEAFEHLELLNGLPVRSNPLPAYIAETNSEGFYLIGVSRPGVYYLRVAAEGWPIAERGPLRLDPGSTERVDVTLGNGGAIEVTVKAHGANVAGRVVRVSRGDGFPSTTRTDPSGVLRFDELIPGPWNVELVEAQWNPESFVRYSTARPLTELETSCHVVEGGLVRVVLWVDGSDESSLLLSGRLRVDGQGGTGWQARLENALGFRSDEVLLSSSGTFELRASALGSYRLVLTRPPGKETPPSVLMDSVAFESSQAHWSLSVDTASLEGDVPATSAGEGGLLHLWSNGSAECWTPLLPDGNGRLSVQGLPAGPGHVVRAELDRPLTEQTVETLFEVRLVPGTRNDLVWPR